MPGTGKRMCLSNQRQAGNYFSIRRRNQAIVQFAGIILFFLLSAIHSSADPVLVTYGREALTKEGDSDYVQVIYISVPDTFTDRLYLHIFDPDSFGEHDLIYGVPNTKTQFSLYGGAGVFTAPTAQQLLLNSEDLTTGKRIHQKVFGVDASLNERAVTGSTGPRR